jgi:hypothetical protein
MEAAGVPGTSRLILDGWSNWIYDREAWREV